MPYSHVYFRYKTSFLNCLQFLLIVLTIFQISKGFLKVTQNWTLFNVYEHKIAVKKTEIIGLENEISERFTRPFSTYAGRHFFALADHRIAAKLCKGVKRLMFLPVTLLVLPLASYEETCVWYLPIWESHKRWMNPLEVK